MTSDNDATRAAGAVTNPKGTERLHEYWVHGAGASKVRWGEPGDFDRCVLHLGKFIKDPKGYCASAHHAALGIWPATHAAMEKKATGRADVTGRADTKKPYGDVTYADPKNGKYPVNSVDRAKAAWAYINMPKNAAQYPLNGVTLAAVKGRIKAALRRFGVQVAEDQPASRSEDSRAESMAPFYRSFPLEDISIRSGGDGRTVEAYAAVFNTAAPVRDQDGEYLEELDPAVFNRAISDAAPQGSRKNWRIGVFYNHGLTIMGTPSDRHSMPVGKILDVKADARGLWTEIRYNRSALADEVLENIREGSIPGYSFSGNFRRSEPPVPRGGFRRGMDGAMRTVRRLESTLRELGPTPFPVYADTGMIGIRSDMLLGAMMNDPDMAMRMFGQLRDGAPDGDSPLSPGAPHPGDSPAADSRQLVRSGRSVREDMQAARSAFLQRHRRQTP